MKSTDEKGKTAYVILILITSAIVIGMSALYRVDRLIVKGFENIFYISPKQNHPELGNVFFYSERDVLQKMDSINLITANSSILHLFGSVDRSGRVELEIGSKKVAETVTHSSNSGDSSRIYSNVFEFYDIRLHPGNNNLIIHFFIDNSTSWNSEKKLTVKYDASQNRGIVFFPRTRIVKNKSPLIATNNRFLIEGASSPGSNVKLKVRAEDENGKRFKETRHHIITRCNKDGYFNTMITFPRPGEYSITASTIGKSKESSDSSALEVFYDPSAYRKTVVVISYDRVSVDLRAVYPKFYRPIKQLISKEISLENYLSSEFGYFLGNLVYYSYRDAVPEITIHDNMVTLKASLVFKRSWGMPVLRGETRIVPDGRFVFPIASPNDSLLIKVKDYQTESYSPVPEKIENGFALWSGKNQHDDYGKNIKVGLSYNAFGSLKGFWKIFSLSPYHIFNNYSIINIIYALLGSVPFLWIKSLLHRRRKLNEKDYKFNQLFKKIIFGMLVLFWITPLDYLAIESMEWINPETFFNKLGVSRLTADNRYIYLVEGVLPIIGSVSLLILFINLFRLFIRNRDFGTAIRSLSFVLSGGALVNIVLEVFLVFNPYSHIYTSEPNKFNFMPLIQPTAFFVIALIVIWTLLVFPKSEERKLKIWEVIALVIFVIVASYPAGYNIDFLFFKGSGSIYDLYFTFYYFLSFIGRIFPYILFLGTAQLLKREAGSRRREKFIVSILGLVLFSAFVIGIQSNLFMIPVPFLLALHIYSRHVCKKDEEIKLVSSVSQNVFKRRRVLLNQFLKYSEAQSLLTFFKQSRKKISEGDLSLPDYLQRRKEFEAYTKLTSRVKNLSRTLNTKDVVLNLGPYSNNWKNAIHAVKKGLLLAVPFLIINLFTYILKDMRFQNHFLTLWIIIQIASYLAEWAINAFFFGYYFSCLRGNSGLMKGVHLSLAVIFCLCPVWITSDLSSLKLSADLLLAGQIFLFFTILGIWGFDYHTFKDSLKEQFSWRKFTDYSENIGLTALASVFVTTAGVALTAVLTGQFTEIIKVLMQAVLPQMPVISK